MSYVWVFSFGSWGSKFFGVKAGMGVVRSFRTVRLFLLVKRMPGLMSLVETIIACIKPALHIAAISMLLFYLYAIVGMKLFGAASTDRPYCNEENNFKSFPSSLMLLFQVVCGQTMMNFVHDLRDHGTLLPFLFLSTFFFIIVFIS